MLDPRWRKMLRDAWLHKARSLLVVFAIAVAMIGAGALLDAWALVRRVTQETYLGSEPVSATLRMDNVDDALLADVRALPEISEARARRVVLGKTRANGALETVEIFSLDDFTRERVGKLSSEVGPWPPPDGALVIERSALDFSGATVGEPIGIAINGAAPTSVPVVGVARDVSLAPGWMDHVIYAFATPATLVSLGAPATFDQLQFRVRDDNADRSTVRRIAYAAKALAEARGHTVSSVDVPVPNQHMHAAQMDSLMQTQGAFGALTLLVSAFLIVNLVSAMLASQVREIGVMKTVGARTGQLAAMYLGFALLLGVVATALALPAALAIGRFYAGFKADMLNFPIGNTAIPSWTIALQLAVGALLPVVAAAIPVWRGCRSPVATALRDIGVAEGAAVSARRGRLAFGTIGRPALLSIGNAFRRRQRMFLTLLALAAGGAVFLGAANLRVAVRASVDRIFTNQRFDVTVRMTEPQPRSKLEAVIAATPGISRAEAWPTARAAATEADGTRGNAFTLVGVAPDTPLIAAEVESGRWLRVEDSNALVVTRALQKDDPTLVPGTTVTLTIDGAPTTWTIVGEIDAGPLSSAFATRGALDRLSDTEQASTIAVAMNARDATSQLQVTSELRGALEREGMPVSSSNRIEEGRRTTEDHLIMVVDFLGVMSWVMIVVGGMGLASTMSLAVLERTREIGVLRAIGARHRDIHAMFQIEGLVIALASWLVSLPLSVPMSLALGDAFGRVMFEVPARYVPDGGGVVKWLVLVVVTSVIACAWPAWRANRVSTRAALGYE